MMKKFIGTSNILVFLITLIIFSSSYFFSISTIIIHTLSFLILLEVVRTIYDYTVKPINRVKVRYIIDGGILFSIRELFVGMVMMKTVMNIALIIIAVSLIVMGVLIYFRHKVIKSSPDSLEKCYIENNKKGN